MRNKEIKQACIYSIVILFGNPKASCTSLQAGHTGVASNAILRITDYKTIHTFPSLYVNNVSTITTLEVRILLSKSKAQEVIQKIVIKIKRFTLFFHYCDGPVK